jgi:hypothetical protein
LTGPHGGSGGDGPGASGSPAEEETVASVAALYLGNILYAIELAAISLVEQGKPTDAAFYRGIARKLAEARGRERTD